MFSRAIKKLYSVHAKKWKKNWDFFINNFLCIPEYKSRDLEAGSVTSLLLSEPYWISNAKLPLFSYFGFRALGQTPMKIKVPTRRF